MNDIQDLEWIGREIERLEHDLNNAISIADEELLEQKIEDLKHRRELMSEEL